MNAENRAFNAGFIFGVLLGSAATLLMLLILGKILGTGV
jgi:hypothetical protein